MLNGQPAPGMGGVLEATMDHAALAAGMTHQTAVSPMEGQTWQSLENMFLAELAVRQGLQQAIGETAIVTEWEAVLGSVELQHQPRVKVGGFLHVAVDYFDQDGFNKKSFDIDKNNRPLSEDVTTIAGARAEANDRLPRGTFAVIEGQKQPPRRMLKILIDQ